MKLPSPTTPAGPVAAHDRIVLLDVLRGLALLGIVVVNVRVMKNPIGAEPVSWATLGPVDGVAHLLVSVLATAKFYLLFAFLFGYGLAIQADRAQAQGASLVPRYLRRLAGLFIFGLVHAVFLFAGDVLMVYAVSGLVLLGVRRLGWRTLVAMAGGLVLLSAGMLMLLGLLFVVAGDGLTTTNPAAAAATAEAYRGAPAEVIAQRVRDLPIALFNYVFVQVPSILALFMLGLAAARAGLLTDVGRHRQLLRRLVGLGLTVGLAGSLVAGLLELTGNVGLALVGASVLIGTAPLLTGAYIGVVALLWESGRRRVLGVLAPVGQMALTNYLLESVLAALVFTGYGLTLYGRTVAAAGLGIAVAIWLLLVPWSHLWLRAFRMGPAEWFLRALTYLHLPRLRRGGQP